MFRQSLSASCGARCASALAPWVALVMLAFPLNAAALDLSVKLEPGVAIPLTAPQSDIYGVGGGQAIKLLFGLAPFLDIGPSGAFLLLPASAGGGESGVVWGAGGSLRFKRPHDAVSLLGISPWLDVDLMYIRTGDLNRFGFATALGLSFPLGETRSFWLGPFVRYLHVVQPERAGYDNRDAKVLIAGISFEFGTGLEQERQECVTAPVEIQYVDREVISCPDRDGDGVPDSVDRCPDKPGTMDNWGCPVYEKIEVKSDKLELREKIQFAWDDAKIEDVSRPVLDEVAQALQDNPSFRVRIEGHASSEGGDEHNQTLSERRAVAVLDYLVARGVSRDRLTSKGFGSAVPLEPNTTAAGRETNRRVEFVVNFILVNDGGAE